MKVTRHPDETLVWGLAIGSPELPSILLALWAVSDPLSTLTVLCGFYIARVYRLSLHRCCGSTGLIWWHKLHAIREVLA